MPKCYKCSFLLDVESIHFRTECSQCHTYQHSCVGCRFYAPGKPNECSIPGTDPIRDRETFNFCDEFKPAHDQGNVDYEAAKEKAKKLLGG